MAQVLPLSRWNNMKLPELEYFSCDEDEEDSDSDDKPIIIHNEANFQGPSAAFDHS